MKTAFAFEIRVIACGACGAPVAVGGAGGRQDCTHCKSPQQTRAASRQVQRAAALPEDERLSRLRLEDNAVLRPPAEVAALFVGVELLPWKISEALGRWKQLREQAQQKSAPDAEHSFEIEFVLHRLSLALAKHFGDEGDFLRARSLLEGALEAAQTARLRQSLIGALSRSAIQVGDVAAAEAWLALCDPTPTDLMMDTAYRYARALIDTAHHRYDRVLAVLGHEPGQVPIDNEHEAPCVALRAHAFEQQGHAQRAIEQVRHFFAHSSAFQRYLFGRFRAQYSSWKLCARSAPLADLRQRRQGAQLSGKAAGAPWFALGATAAMVLLGVLIGAPLALFVAIGPGHFAAGLCGLLAATFGALTVVELKKARRARHLRLRGVPAAARVVHARGTGQWTMGVPQLLYRVLVLPTEGTPFLAHSMFHADAQDRRRFSPGALVIVRMDPSSRGDVQFELD